MYTYGTGCGVEPYIGLYSYEAQGARRGEGGFLQLRVTHTAVLAADRVLLPRSNASHSGSRHR